MRISDWRSDVCSSDLIHEFVVMRGIVVEDDQRPGSCRLDDAQAFLPGRMAESLEARILGVGVGGIVDHDVGAAHQFLDRRVASRFVMLGVGDVAYGRSEEHTSELQSLMRISYAVFCLKKKTK